MSATWPIRRATFLGASGLASSSRTIRSSRNPMRRPIRSAPTVAAVIIPSPPSWMSPARIPCPSSVKSSAGTTACRPVTVTALTDSKKASNQVMPLFAAGIFSRKVPTTMSPAKARTINRGAESLGSNSAATHHRGGGYLGAAQRLGDQLGYLRGVRRGADAGPAQGFALGFGGALAAGDYGARVAHRLALGGGEARDVGDDGGLHLRVHVLGGELLSVAPDLPDHHHAPGLGVGLELLEDLDEVGPDYRVSADAHRRALADPALRELVDDLVGERSAPRHYADVAGREDVARHDGDVGLLGREGAGAVRADERRVLCLQVIGHPHHVVYRDPLRDAADHAHATVQRLEDRVRGEWRGNEDYAGVRLCLPDGFLDGVEDGHALVVLPALAGRHPGDDVGAALEHPPRVEGALPARYPLD